MNRKWNLNRELVEVEKSAIDVLGKAAVLEHEKELKAFEKQCADEIDVNDIDVDELLG